MSKLIIDSFKNKILPSKGVVYAYSIYHGDGDLQGRFVVKLREINFEIVGFGHYMAIADSLEEARKKVPDNLDCFMISENFCVQEPGLIETWF